MCLLSSLVSRGEGAGGGLRAFSAGEMLVYEVRYGFVTGARVVFTTRDTVLEGRGGFFHRIVGRTQGLLNTLYPVRDEYWAIADRVGDYPWRAVRDVAEQDYRDYKRDDYLREAGRDSVRVARETGDTLTLPGGTRDVVSAFYYLRNALSGLTLREGMMIRLPMLFNGDFYAFGIRYEGQEDVQTRFGRVPCHRFKPLVETGGIFEDQEALTVWLSRDANHVPVRVRFELFLGSMYCDLVGYRGLRHPLYLTR